MENQSCIYWFSGTGNSLYAAKKFSALLGDLPLRRITSDMPSKPVGGEGARVGFVFPSYYGNLPRAVCSFIEQLEILPGTYLFGVVTMGALGQGSVAALRNVFAQKQQKLSYGRGVRMPANYIMAYNPTNPFKSAELLKKADQKLEEFAVEIATRKKMIKAFPLTTRTLFKNIAALDEKFGATDACTSCGLCEQICPVKNIRLEDGKPTWLHHCEHCTACISWCPAGAIEYGTATVGRRRYHNPQITAHDLR